MSSSSLTGNTNSRLVQQQQAYEATKAMCQNYSLPENNFDFPGQAQATASGTNSSNEPLNEQPKEFKDSKTKKEVPVKDRKRLKSALRAANFAAASLQSVSSRSEPKKENRMSIETDARPLLDMDSGMQTTFGVRVPPGNSVMHHQPSSEKDEMTHLQRCCMEYARSVIERNSLNNELMNRKMPAAVSAPSSSTNHGAQKNADWNLSATSMSQGNAAFKSNSPFAMQACASTYPAAPSSPQSNEMELEDKTSCSQPRRVSFAGLVPPPEGALKRKFMWNN